MRLQSKICIINFYISLAFLPLEFPLQAEVEFVQMFSGRHSKDPQRENRTIAGIYLFLIGAFRNKI